MKRARFYLFVVTIMGLIAEAAAIETWTSPDGRSIEAEIIATTDAAVKMRRADGFEFSAPISVFSQSDQERIRNWTPPPMDLIAPQQAVYVIETPNGRGTGFLVAANNQAWLYTNQHVIDSPRKLRVIGSSGGTLKVGELEIAKDRDLARFKVDLRSGLAIAPDPTHGDEIIVYGNSRGTGHITEDYGKIVGISPTEIEVDADIVAGNSGGPIVNASNEVFAVSAYVLFADQDRDATIAGTRFEASRRFGLLINREIPFVRVDLDDYADAHTIYQDAVRDTKEVIEAIRTVDERPTSLIVAGAFTNSSVERAAERYNRKLKRNYGRAYAKDVLDFFDDVVKISEKSIESAISQLNSEAYGWMREDLLDRQRHIEALRERIEQLEDTYK